MESINFLIAVFVIIMALQYSQNWIVIGVIALMLIINRSLPTFFFLIAVTIGLYIAKQIGLLSNWPVVIFILIVLALIVSIKPKAKSSYSDLFSSGGNYDNLFGGSGGG
ncbi:MAG: hypothetical protein ABH821_06280, partial [archaeon]